MHRPSLVPFAAALLLPLGPLLGQQGYKNFENKHKGITFVYPASHDELPLPPTERLWVAKYVMRQQPDELKKVDERLFQAETPFLQVFRFELPGAVTPSGARPADGAAAEGAAAAGAAGDEGPPVLTWEQFATMLGRLELRPDPKKPDHFTVHPRLRGRGPGRGKDAEANEFEGYLVRRLDGQRVVGVIGFSYQPGAKTLQSQVTRMAASIKEVADDAAERADAEIDRLYASGKFQAVAWRKQARAKMAKGWKALDTENYLIVHHSTNAALIRRIARDIEAMRAFYAEQFPPSKPIDAVAIVRVCRTKDEYHEYGGPPSTGGYWHPVNEELVFYDYSYTMQKMDTREKRQLGGHTLSDDDSLLVLYHEALHQYMHYAIGEFAPHDWFNEGYGDYFSGAVVGESTGKVLRVDPSPWRIHLAKDMCEHGEGFLSLKDVLHAERATFYNPARAGHYYAAAWSFVHFLKHGKAVQGNPKWAALLAGYFDTVKAEYARATEGVAAGDQQQRAMASMKARREALKKVLDGIDLQALEAAWVQYVVAMKDPWPQLRKQRK
ncbi:MAG: hypothetical protein U1F60_09165 [Planctomycetota bacterium]